MRFKIKEISINTGNIQWGAENNTSYYVIKLGERL